MKRIYTHLGLFLLPFILNAFIVFLVDPYNFINKSHLISDEAKYNCICRTTTTIWRGQVPWKMENFDRNPMQNVSFGDSRMTHINDKYYKEQTGEGIYNFAIAGGNLKTSIDFFWYCAERTKLKNVFFQLGFMNFNDNVNYDILTPYRSFKSNTLNYFISGSVWIDTYSLLYYVISGDKKFADINYRERKIDTWQRGYNLVDLRLTEYAYPQKFIKELDKISEYCKLNDIKLTFIYLPTYKSFQDKIEYYGREDSFQSFFKEINKLGDVVNPSSFKEFSDNAENYKDVFHFNQRFDDSVSTGIWKEYLNEHEVADSTRSI
jgi:hypothetical protein